MSIFKFLFRSLAPIEVSTATIDDHHVLITTRQGNETKRTIAIVFTENEIRQIDMAKKSLNGISKVEIEQ